MGYALYGGDGNPQHKWTIWWVLFKHRKYVIDKIKKPLTKAITILASRYPEPTREHTRLPNTHILIDIKDKFFEHENNKGREALLRAIWGMFIIEYEHDPYYQDRLDWIVEQVVEAVVSGKWEPREVGHPKKCWKERWM